MWHYNVYKNSKLTFLTLSKHTSIILTRLNQEQNTRIPDASSSKQANAFLMTSSGSVPFNFSPNIVKNIVKFIGPGAQFIISSKYWSVGFFPVQNEFTSLNTCATNVLKFKPNNSWQQTYCTGLMFLSIMCVHFTSNLDICHPHTVTKNGMSVTAADSNTMQIKLFLFKFGRITKCSWCCGDICVALIHDQYLMKRAYQLNLLCQWNRLCFGRSC